MKCELAGICHKCKNAHVTANLLSAARSMAHGNCRGHQQMTCPTDLPYPIKRVF